MLADQLGVDFMGLGEHHRPDFAISAPEVVLAAIAARTSTIREQFGRDPQPVAVHSPGYVAETDEQARDELWPHYAAMHARIGRGARLVTHDTGAKVAPLVRETLSHG